MRCTYGSLLLSAGLALLLTSRAPAADPTEPDADGQRLLKKYGVTPDAAGLRAYFRALRPAEARKEVAALIVKLGSSNFKERETATRRLTLLALVAFRGKGATLMSASPGALGGLRGLVHVRSILGNIGVIVLPDQIAVARAHEAFRPDGSLLDPRQQAGIEGLGKTLASFLAKVKA